MSSCQPAGREAATTGCRGFLVGRRPWLVVATRPRSPSRPISLPRGGKWSSARRDDLPLVVPHYSGADEADDAVEPVTKRKGMKAPRTPEGAASKVE